MKRELNKEQKEAILEAKLIARDMDKSKGKLPPKEKNILEWTPKELKRYVQVETMGLSVRKRVKFGKELMERIENEKQKRSDC